MKLLSALVSLALLLPFAACAAPDYGRPLPPGAPALIKVSMNDPHPDFSEGFTHRDAILPALERSIAWTKKPSSKQFFPMEGISFERACDSLVRFKQLLTECRNADEFSRRLALEFSLYKSAGWNAKGGGVLFTAYCTPIFEGSRTKSETYKYPLYALPPDLVKAKDGSILGRRTASGSLEPYPARREIEASMLLAGKHLELVYLKDPLDVFIAQVNGSACIETATGEKLKFGYSGKNGREYSSLGKELIRAKEIAAKEMSLTKIRAWGVAHPEKLREYMSHNESYVFFQEIDGNPSGSLGFAVEGERSLATDKLLFPRGGIVFVDTPKAPTSWHWPWESSDPPRPPPCRRFMLDQDTGGAIRTAGRADMYLGIGPEAEQRAGQTMAEGQLYYFFVNESEVVRASP